MGRMPASLVLAAVCVVGALLALVQAYTPRNWPIPLAIGLYVRCPWAARCTAPSCNASSSPRTSRRASRPTSSTTSTPTRRAFALDRVEERELSGDALLTAADISRNADTLENVRLWDHQPLLETFGQIQEIRTYYEFGAVDNDRYRIDGRCAR
jgi:uncharacterized membrane protein (UPF0182 family)